MRERPDLSRCDRFLSCHGCSWETFRDSYWARTSTYLQRTKHLIWPSSTKWTCGSQSTAPNAPSCSDSDRDVHWNRRQNIQSLLIDHRSGGGTRRCHYNKVADGRPDRRETTWNRKRRKVPPAPIWRWESVVAGTTDADMTRKTPPNCLRRRETHRGAFGALLHWFCHMPGSLDGQQMSRITTPFHNRWNNSTKWSTRWFYYRGAWTAREASKENQPGIPCSN